MSFAVLACSCCLYTRLRIVGICCSFTLPLPPPWSVQSELESTDAEEWRSMQELDLPDPVKSVTDKPGSRQLG